MSTVTKNRNIYKAVASIILFIGVMALAAYIFGSPIINFISDGESFRIWVKSHGMWGKAVFVLIVAFQVVIAFIPGEPVELAAGYAFGRIEGTLLSIAGIAAGSVVIFRLVKVFGVKIMNMFFPTEDINRLNFLKNEKRLELIIFIIFFIPGTPKDILSYFAGLTPLKISRWIVISTLARIPSVVTSAVAGSAIGEKNFVFAAAVFAVTGLISFIGLYFYNSYIETKNSNYEQTFDDKLKDF